MKWFVLLIAAAMVIFFPLFSQWMWKWSMPICFPKAVAEGYIVKELPYKVPFVCCFLALIGGLLQSFLNDIGKSGEESRRRRSWYG